MQKVKPFDNCQVCGSTDLYFAYTGSTFHLNQICNQCHTVHYLTTVLPKEKRGKNMRIVPNLNDIDECPNCGRRGLIRTTNEFGRPFKQCQICTEEIYENETTCSEEQHTVDCITELITSKELFEKQKKKDDFIFEMREEISNLTWTRPDPKTQILVENMQNIFNRIIDYIEEN